MYNNNLFLRYSSHTTILLTMKIFKPRLFFSHATRLHTRHIEFLLLVVCFVLSFYIPSQQFHEHSWSRMFGLSLFRESYCNFIFVCVFCTHCCLCIVYTLPVVAFVYIAFTLSICLILMVFVFVAFDNRIIDKEYNKK